MTELMGSETYLYLKTTGKDDNIIARVDPRTSSRAGDTIKVGFRREPSALLRQGDREDHPESVSLVRTGPFASAKGLFLWHCIGKLAP